MNAKITTALLGLMGDHGHVFATRLRYTLRCLDVARGRHMTTGLTPVITKLNAVLAERYWTAGQLTQDEMEALHLLERAKIALTQARAKLQKAEVERADQ